MRAANRPQFYRLRRMLDIIREGTREGRLPNRGTFCRELEIAPRTAARDLDFLREELNAPVAYDAARHGYQLTDATYALPTIELSRREIFSFAIARKLLERFEGTPLELDMRSVLGKIADSLEGTVSLGIESLTEQFTVLGDDYARVEPAIWEAAALAINRRQHVKMVYQRFDGVTKVYQLEPYHLLAYHGNWYLLAMNRAAEKMETFALSRCRTCCPTQVHFQRDKGFDARRFIRDWFGVTLSEKPWKVRLLFSKQVATYVKERVWHPSQHFHQRRGGDLEMRLVTSGRKELVRWILSWMPEVKVFAPKELRARVLQRLNLGAARNRIRPR